MQNVYHFCVTMRHLPWLWRLLMVLLSFILIEALIISATMHGSDRGVSTLLVLTGILAVLLFQWRVAFPFEFALLLIYLSIGILLKGWSTMIIMSFAAGTFTDLFIITIVRFLWYAWDLTEEMRKKEKELATVKDQFITNIYHELRTPLTCVLGPLALLRDDRHQLSNEEQQFFLDQAVFAGNELQRLVENVLHATQADSDIRSPWTRVFTLDRLVLDVLNHVGTVAHKQALRFGAEMLPEDVISVDFSMRPFTVRSDTGSYQSHAVIIATGASAKWLGLPKEKQFQGRGVTACATCDGFFFRGKDVLVVGGGDTATEGESGRLIRE